MTNRFKLKKWVVKYPLLISSELPCFLSSTFKHKAAYSPEEVGLYLFHLLGAVIHSFKTFSVIKIKMVRELNRQKIYLFSVLRE